MTSFREMAERMDPVRPPDRIFGGERAGDPLQRSRGADDGLADLDAKGLRELHRFRPGNEDDAASFRTVCARHENGTSHRLLFYNTWLMTGFKRTIAEAPDIPARAREIGMAIGESGHDIVALSELFEGDERNAILDGIREFRSDVTSELGPEHGVDKSSGLCTITAGRPITRMDRIEYSNEGVRDRDADAWANKGVLLTEVDLGPGRVDLYSTHLLSGGGIEEARIATGVATAGASELIPDDSHREIRDDQLAQAVRFIQRTHAPENVVIFGGDFNVHADNSEYANLIDRVGEFEMAAVPTDDGYVNLYPYLVEYFEEKAREAAEAAAEESILDAAVGFVEDAAGALADFVSGDVSSVADLATEAMDWALTGHHDEMARELGIPVETYTLRMRDLWRSRGGNVGATAHSKSSPQNRCAFDPDEPGPHYCDDYTEDETDDTARIDYVFVADPVSYNSFDLDVSRVRRRPFPRVDREVGAFFRDPEDDEGPNYLSDHLGLELTVVASRP